MRSNIEEKTEFSNRLKHALENCNHPISPTYLANEFNNRYSGTEISVQAANNWLQGKAIPNQDKLSVLSIWLNCSSQWLRFGDDGTSKNLINSSSDELDYLLKFRKLKLSQQLIIKNLIDEFNH